MLGSRFWTMLAAAKNATPSLLPSDHRTSMGFAPVCMHVSVHACLLMCLDSSMCMAIAPTRQSISLYLPLSAPLFERMDPRTDSQRRRQQKDMHSLGNRSFHLYSNISDTKGHTKTGARTGMDSDTKGHTKTQTHTDAHTRTQRPAFLLTIHTCMNPDASRHTCTCTCV